MSNIVSINHISLKERADAIRKLGKQTLANVIEIGRLLTECKDEIEHGGWLPWLKAEFGWSEWTARCYVSIYKSSQFGSVTTSDLNLPIKSLYLLSSPSTPESARNEVIARAEAGERLKHDEVARIVRNAARSEPKKLTGAIGDVAEKIKQAGDRGLTSPELLKMLPSIKQNTIYSRVFDLKKRGVIHENGKKRAILDGQPPSPVYVFGRGRPKGRETTNEPRTGGRAMTVPYFGPDAPPMKHLTRQEVDPEFVGTSTEWIDKYGHVQIMTAEQYATMRFADWASGAKALAKRWKELPELRNVDHNWLRAPKAYDIAKLTEAMEFLRPVIAELEALLACAVSAKRREGSDQPGI